MATPGRPGARYGSNEWRERLSRGRHRANQRRRELLRVTPADLKALRCVGAIPAHLRELLEVAAETVATIRCAAEGGPPGSDRYRPLSPQRVAFLEGAQRLLALALAETRRALLEGDGESAGGAARCSRRPPP